MKGHGLLALRLAPIALSFQLLLKASVV